MSPTFTNREVREEANLLLKLGFEYLGQDGTSHHRFRHRDHGEIRLPNSPSRFKKWRENHRARLARRLGQTTRWLREMDGDNLPKHSAKTRKKRQKRIRQAIWALADLGPAPPPPSPPLPLGEEIEAKAQERRQAQAEGDVELVEQLTLELEWLYARKRRLAA